MTTEIQSFLGSYRETWEAVVRGNEHHSTLTPYFGTPCFMLSVNGVVTTVQSTAEIETFNEGRLHSFREGGVQHCRFQGIDSVSQGPNASLAIVNWELTKLDGTLERAWRHYYTIVHGDGPTRILVSAFQTGAGL